LTKEVKEFSGSLADLFLLLIELDSRHEVEKFYRISKPGSFLGKFLKYISNLPDFPNLSNRIGASDHSFIEIDSNRKSAYFCYLSFVFRLLKMFQFDSYMLNPHASGNLRLLKHASIVDRWA